MESGLQGFAGALLTLALVGVTGALFLAVTIGMLVKGPVKWVKVATALLLVSGFATAVVLTGIERALVFVGVTAAVTVGSMVVATLAWSQPRRKSFQPAQPSACPGHARDRVERWSAELAELGFSFHSDQTWEWRFAGGPRRAFVRFFNHPGEPMRAELHVLESPKVAARILATRSGDGRTLLTCDQQSDTEFFPSETVRSRRVGSRSSIAEMVAAHRAAAMDMASGVATDDPVTAHLEEYHGWVAEQIERRTVAVRGDKIGMRPTSIPGAVVRVFGAWFH